MIWLYHNKSSNILINMSRRNAKESTIIFGGRVHSVKINKSASEIKYQDCNCQGMKHPVVSNCLNCGRIRCEKEGPLEGGVCAFCELPFQELDANQIDQEMKDAKKLTTRLLSYAEQKKQTVIDEQRDYFTINNWMSDEEKKRRKHIQDELEKIKTEKRKIKFDFIGRKIYEVEDEALLKREQELKNELLNIPAQLDDHQRNNQDEEETKRKLDLIKNMKNSAHISKRALDEETTVLDDYFHQDEEYALGDIDLDYEPYKIEYFNPSKNEDDKGLCMSMHQPWASLLIYGIKQAEGRSWNSNHRGRLWIASTAKIPTEEDIQFVESQYRSLGFDKFPKVYPTGSLLGCCDVEDVLSAEEYEKKYPNGQPSECEFVFVIKNPRRLQMPISNLGHPKIYHLDPNLHKAAKLGLKSLP